MGVHSFAESLALSQQQADNPIWDAVYRKAFPSFLTMACVRKDGWAQRGRIDRVITLESGRTITVDEKVRAKDYGDILLEYWSDEARGVRGWVAKDLACDYIAYAVLPSRVCYMLPFQALRRAWRDNCREWITAYGRIEAKNQGYVTVSVGVPAARVLRAISDAGIVRWGETC